MGMSPLLEAARGKSSRDTDQNTSLYTEQPHPHWLMQAQVSAKEANTFHCSNQHWLLSENFYSVDVY